MEYDHRDKNFQLFKFLFNEMKSPLSDLLFSLSLDVSERSFFMESELEWFDELVDRINNLSELVFSNIVPESLSSIDQDDIIGKVIGVFDTLVSFPKRSLEESVYKDKIDLIVSSWNRIVLVHTRMMAAADGAFPEYSKMLLSEVVKAHEFPNKMIDFEHRFDEMLGSAGKIRNYINNSSEKIEKINDEINERINNFENTFNRKLNELNEKIGQVDVLIGLASNKVLSHDYSNSASDEKRLADNFRLASIVFIVAITSLLIIVLLETANYGFQIESSIFKVILGLLLSIPAAFFAKESNKHRLRQNALHQVSLELNTISPFLEDLPLEEKIKIKANFANKIFGSSRQETTEQYTIPTNVIELITEIIKKAGPK